MQTIADQIKKIENLLPLCLGSERFQIRKDLYRLKGLAQKQTQPDGWKRKLAGIEHRLRASIGKKRERKENVPEIVINKDLPIASKQDEIVESIKQHQILIVSGDTGSGKTTQIPKLCLKAGRGIDGKIGLTQPRRIAATTVARRIAEELHEDLGQSVGYKIRFDEQISRNSYIKIMTDGILLAEAQTDPFLNEYDTLIIDEAHERSLNIDFVLGLLKTLTAKRNDLKLIITSATIDTEKFSKAFHDAPVIEVSGRMYPVEIQYWPPEKFSGDEDMTHVEMAVAALDRLEQFGPFGDILVFMPTEQDIRETCDLIEGRKYRGVSVFPLFARLSSDEQKRVFSPASGRKIIVATNVAETSITIPGIKYVVDTGLARMLRYLPRTRTTALPVEPISRSSADQRMGRCGRVENGICIRLYSEDNYQERPLYTTPEILRSNLAEVILRMIALNLGDIDAFPFIDRPASKSISDGFEVLKELGAIREIKERKKSRPKSVLTPLGTFMAKIPLDPRISRMLIEAEKEHCISEILVIASALSIQDPRERPLEKADEADQAQARFIDPSSDFITLLNLWNCYQDVWVRHKSVGKLKRFCKEHFLSFKRMREWRDVHEQLRSILEESGMNGDSEIKPVETPLGEREFSPLYEAIHRSILSGFLSNIAQKKEKNFYKAAKDREVMIFPGSGLFNRGTEWIVAAEMIETSRLFARTCAGIRSQWLEILGKGLCRHTYQAPQWDGKQGEVIAFEQVSLFGLVIVEKRTVSYGKINPSEATEIFIRNALVDDEIREKFGFMEHNRHLRKKIVDLENRLRRRDILISPEEMCRIYGGKLGNHHVYSISTLKKFIKKAGGDDLLKMTLQDMANYLPDAETVELFPDQIPLGKNTFFCRYQFTPGDQQDGVTVKIPASMISSVDHAAVDWHAPGFMEEKIFFLIKGLPKAYRKKLVPVADTVKVIIEEMPRSEKSLLSALSQFIFERFKVDIPASAWSYDHLPDYLKIRFSILDEKGKTIVSGRDKQILTGNFSGQTDSEEIAEAKKVWERDGIDQWDFDDIPETITVRGKTGQSWVLFPGLKPSDNDTVSLRLFSNRNTAIQCHKQGIVTLFKHYLADDLKFLKKNLAMEHIKSEYTALCGGHKNVENHLFQSILKDLFFKNIRNREAFYRHAKSVKGKILRAGIDKTALASEILKTLFETRQGIYHLECSNRQNKRFIEFCNRMRHSLENLVPENFLELYADERLVHLVRYIRAIGIRAQKWLINPEKDLAKEEMIQPFSDKLVKMLSQLDIDASMEKRIAVEEFFWLIEEFKVSLFAQELKTVIPVSEKRLSQKSLEIERLA